MSVATKLAGTTFQSLGFDLHVNDEVTVVREKGEPYDSDNTPAYAVMLEGLRIGYIPRIETVKAYMMAARDSGDKAEYQRRFEECNILEYLRDCLYVDFERNHITPRGRIVSLRWLDKETGWNGDGIGELKGISIAFDYE